MPQATITPRPKSAAEATSQFAALADPLGWTKALFFELKYSRKHNGRAPWVASW